MKRLKAKGRRAAARVKKLVAGQTRAGAVPTPYGFDPNLYRQMNPDVAGDGADPYRHYRDFGAAEGRWPHPLFNPGHYLAQSGPLPAGETPFGHYLAHGAAAGFSPHPLFDPVFYCSQVAGGVPDGVAPFAHFAAVGAAAGVPPHPAFAARYADQLRCEAGFLTADDAAPARVIEGAAWLRRAATNR